LRRVLAWKGASLKEKARFWMLASLSSFSDLSRDLIRDWTSLAKLALERKVSMNCWVFFGLLFFVESGFFVDDFFFF